MLEYLIEYGLLEVSGKDADKLLQGQLTCDVTALESKACQLAAHCNAKGRIVSLFHLLKYDDTYWLLMPKMMLEIALKQLKKYALFYQTSLTIRDDKLIGIGKPSDEHYADYPSFNYSNEHALYLIPHHFTSRDEAPTTANWHLTQIKESLPGIYPQTTGTLLPHEIGLERIPQAISFSKGCFTGQEIIARMHYRGKSKKHLQHCYTQTATQETLLGASLTLAAEASADNICGIIIDYAVEEDRYHCLAIFDRELLPGTQLVTIDKRIILQT